MNQNPNTTAPCDPRASTTNGEKPIADLSIKILYQDDYLVAIDKPAGMLVHPVASAEEVEPCAMKLLRDHLGQRVFIINRLDRPTSGILLFALDKKTAGITQQSFEKREVTKTYLAIVNAKTPDHWQCETPLRTTPEEEPIPAKTSFERLTVKTGEPTLSLLKVTPTTGRFHQIRRHLLEAGFPIVGDFRYAGIDHSLKIGETLGTGTRMLLQAKTLELNHPHTGSPIKITAPPDPEFLKCFPALS